MTNGLLKVSQQKTSWRAEVSEYIPEYLPIFVISSIEC